jgi:eukaryotic-like serine/threonine-protein kinase
MDHPDGGTMTPPPNMTPLLEEDPPAIGGYELLGRLGQGGFGTVYLARDGAELVALKALRLDRGDDPMRLRGLESEVRVLGVAPKDAVAALRFADLEASRPFLVLDFLDGPTLRDRVDAHGPMGGDDLTELAHALAGTVLMLHDAGVVHRDIKPRNIMLVDRPRMIDFGNADCGPDIWQAPSGALFGSTKWMAHEQVMGTPVGTWTDVHAWALALAFAATGEPPFQAQSIPAMVLRVITVDPTIPETVDPGLANLMRACLAKQSGDRPTMTEVMQTMEGLMSGG